MQVEQAVEESWQATGTDGLPNLKQVAADRLAAHRQRRAAAAAQEAELESRTRQHREAMRTARREDLRRGASVVRDAVMARYERRESYREFLAAEAERAIAQAQAEADVAARSARAVTEAQMALLDELDQINRPEPGPREEAIAQKKSETRGELAHALADIVLGARELIDEPPLLTVMETPQLERQSRTAATPAGEPSRREVSAAGLTVRLFEDMPATRISEARPRRGQEPVEAFPSVIFDEEIAETLTALDEEIDFRRAPEFPQSALLETQAIPGNLIEFPRELVAPRRARPRLAEGPLRDEPGEPQLRIFEVDAEQEIFSPEPLPPSLAPEWQTLQLSGFAAEPAAPSTASDAQTHLTLPLYTASLERRFMAAAVDLCGVASAWMVAGACVVEVAGPGLRGLSLPLAALSGIVSFAVFTVLYQVLFFSLGAATPGMKYARIALCTFGDGNPSRRAMRRRVGSTVLAACPLGLGLAWALLDPDKLGWHDRMSRMYQRAY
ncbi:MAG TPA: RDD family protein [Acidobacteriaceae bacterium]|nr:RDD family protein [Acidobacteriaceae bacterium]